MPPNNDPLARAPAARAHLKALATYPQKRPPTRAGVLLRKLGYSQEVLEDPHGKVISERVARATYGPDWYRICKPTGLEVVTVQGLRALDNMD